MRKSILLIVIALLFSSCQLPFFSAFHHLRRLTILIDKSFQPAEVADIERAVRLWECSLKGFAIFTVYRDITYDEFYETEDMVNSVFIWRADPTDERIVQLDKVVANGTDGVSRFCVGMFSAAYNEHPNAILIVADRLHNQSDINGVFNAALHELGHWLIGINHSQDKESIMYPYIDISAKKITIDDIKQFCDKNDCQTQAPTTCIEGS